jgi:hypothetical protein
MFVDIVAEQVGRIVAAYTFVAAHQPFDETLRDSLIAATSARIAV